MEKFVYAIVETSLVMSVIILSLLGLNLIFHKKYKAKWRYYIWVIVLVGLLLPFKPEFDISVPQVQSPVAEELHANPVAETTDNRKADSADKKEAAATKQKFSIYQILFAIWAIGTVGITFYYIWKNVKFLKMVRRWSSDQADLETLEIFEFAKFDMGLSDDKIELKVCKLDISPMVVGLWNPVVLLPEGKIPADEMELILKHELTHYKRHDLWVKILCLAATVVHWFNPVVYLMSRAVHTDCEASCDEAVLLEADKEERRLYGEAIIGVSERKVDMVAALSTQFYGGKKGMKKRLLSIMDSSNKKVGIAIVLAAFILAVTTLSGSVFASASELTAAQAKQMALQKSGGGTVTKCKLDTEDGIRVYEIEIRNGNVEYSMDIGISDRKIYNYEEENKQKAVSKNTTQQTAATQITAQQAQEIALARTGGGTVTKCIIDNEDGRVVYEIEITNGTMSYDLEVGATDSQVYKFEQEQINAPQINNNAGAGSANSSGNTNAGSTAGTKKAPAAAPAPAAPAPAAPAAQTPAPAKNTKPARAYYDDDDHDDDHDDDDRYDDDDDDDDHDDD